jgi:hypothetical protein
MRIPRGFLDSQMALRVAIRRLRRDFTSKPIDALGMFIAEICMQIRLRAQGTV